MKKLLPLLLWIVLASIAHAGGTNNPGGGAPTLGTKFLTIAGVSGSQIELTNTPGSANGLAVLDGNGAINIANYTGNSLFTFFGNGTGLDSTVNAGLGTVTNTAGGFAQLDGSANLTLPADLQVGPAPTFVIGVTGATASFVNSSGDPNLNTAWFEAVTNYYGTCNVFGLHNIGNASYWAYGVLPDNFNTIYGDSVSLNSAAYINNAGVSTIFMQTADGGICIATIGGGGIQFKVTGSGDVTALSYTGAGTGLTGIASSLVAGEAIGPNGSNTDGNFITTTASGETFLDSGKNAASFDSAGAASTAVSGLVKTYAGNFSGTGTATTSFVVTIGHTMANTNYTATATPVNTLSSAVFDVSAKTTTTFTVTYLAGLTGTVSFDWTVTPFN